MGADVFIDSNVAIERVRATLRGPVIHVLAAGIPEIKHFPSARRFDLLLADLPLLERSFSYFRAHRDLFKAVLVDAEQHPVTSDSEPLSCGRSLDDVVAMVVRSATYRYFRQRLDGKGPDKPAAKPAGKPAAKPVAKSGPALLKAVFPFLRVESAQKPAQPQSKAKALYHAIREYLLYEWQIPLVPTYSQLTPVQVAKLGPRITDLHSSEEILAAATGRPLPAPAAPVPEAAAEVVVAEPRVDLHSLLTEDEKFLWVETLSRPLRDPDVVKAADNGEQAAHVKAALKAVGRDLLKCFVEDLGFDKRQLSVCLVRMLAVLPRSAFDHLVRSGINSPALVKLVAMGKRHKVGPHSTLQECADFVTGQFARPHQPGSGPGKPVEGG